LAGCIAGAADERRHAFLATQQSRGENARVITVTISRRTVALSLLILFVGFVLAFVFTVAGHGSSDTGTGNKLQHSSRPNGGRQF
jgi:hypothetical protein